MKKNLTGFIFLSVLVSSCTSSKQSSSGVDSIFGTKKFAESLVSKVQAKWFKSNDSYQLRSFSGVVSPHMLFDVDPDINKEEATLNFVVSTPEGADYGFEIDQTTGQHYYSKKYCSQDDIWEKLDRPINKANFSVGIVPRILDQLGEPQKIIVFGSRDYYKKHFKTNYFDARIIGGYIEQICPYGGCLNKGEWKSKLVLIGVQVNHKSYKDVKTFSDLQEIVDLDYVKASIENVNGVNQISGNFYPAYRMGGVVSGTQALDFLDRNSIFLTSEKTKKIQSSCFSLYNKIWKDIGRKSSYEVAMNTLNKTDNISTKEYTNKLSELGKLPRNLFYKRFIRKFKIYEHDYKTCMKYVYPSNLNLSKEKHWFFTYYSAVNLLHGLHYSYDCNRKVWAKNPKMSSGLRLVKSSKEFRGCSSVEIDSAFTRSVSFLQTLQDNGHESYRYIDYDKGSAGSHSKIYSWVKTSNKKMNCEDGSQASKKLYNLFPADIKWKKRAIVNKLNKRMIY
jgi:inorganic pyrophosphatase